MSEENLSEAIILAAGMSSRMGLNKMALNLSGKTVLRRMLAETLASKLGKIVVVTRPDQSDSMVEQSKSYSRNRLTVISNFWPEQGMSLSIKLGLTQISRKAQAVMIILGDQILLNAGIIDRIVDESLKTPDRIIVPSVRGRRTNPVIFPETFFEELRRVKGDIGGRKIVATNEPMTRIIELGEEYDDRDIDTPLDYYSICSELDNVRRT